MSPLPATIDAAWPGQVATLGHDLLPACLAPQCTGAGAGALLAEHVSEGLLSVTRAGVIVDCNTACAALLGVPADALRGGALQAHVGPASLAALEEILLSDGVARRKIWLRHSGGAGATRPVLVCGRPMPASDNLICLLVVDAAWLELEALGGEQLRRLEGQLACQASLDALTGLPNRDQMYERLRYAIALGGKERHQSMVAFIGLDQFKSINESLGYHMGDQVLQIVAERLRGQLRKGDMVARHGGDEFIVIVERTDRIATEALMRQLLAVIAEPLLINEHELEVTASAGVCLYPLDGRDAGDLLRNAAAAMARAKQLGCNSHQFYTAALHEQVNHRLTLEAILRHALERDEFSLYYQPQVDLRSGCIVGMEALLRWHHPGVGQISPAQFIPLAEKLGLIVPIGEWVLRAACLQNKLWQDSGLPKVSVSVNLSAYQVRQTNLVEVVRQVLRQTGLETRYLDLELTEGTLMENVELTVNTLCQLKAMGITLSIDDFGTGYSSLSYLKRFPLDVLKIDQSFVRELTTDPNDAAIALSIITLAHSLKLRVIAEGVETAAQLSYLRRHQCDAMQGYYFSRPLNRANMGELLRDNRRLNQPDLHELVQNTLLLIDDDAQIVDLLRQQLANQGYRILSAQSTAEGFELLALNQVQVIMCDQRLPAMSGTEFLGRVKEMYPGTTRIVLSGYTGLPTIIDALNRGAISRVFAKPWVGEVLRQHIKEAFDEHLCKFGA